MEEEKGFNYKRFFVKVLLVVLVLSVRYQYNKIRNSLDVLEFYLNGTRLELPCTVEDIEACGYRVNMYTGACNSDDYGLRTLYVTQDENGMIYEIYTEKALCDLKIYGNVNMMVNMMKREDHRKFEKDFEKAYGEPVEEDYNSRTYRKYKSETEYAYVIMTGYFKVSRIGIVAEKP